MTEICVEKLKFSRFNKDGVLLHKSVSKKSVLDRAFLAEF